MKQEVVVLIDEEVFDKLPKTEIIKILMEFGAPVSIDNREEKEVEITGSMHHNHLRNFGLVIYQWFNEIKQGPGGITVYVRADGPPEITTRAEL